MPALLNASFPSSRFNIRTTVPDLLKSAATSSITLLILGFFVCVFVFVFWPGGTSGPVSNTLSISLEEVIGFECVH